MNANDEELDDILEWDPNTLQWVVLDKMIQPRYHHAISVVSDAEQLCKIEVRINCTNNRAK